jgi:hypothetical protein
MVNIRSTNQIVLSLIDFFKTALPNADIKPGSVIRDLMIDGPSSQIALLYDSLSKISNLQSLRLVMGSDLDRLAQNFGSTRNSPTKSSGVALLTFSSIPATVAINSGSLLTASNGSTFSVLNGISVNSASANTYKSTAVQYQANLAFLGITDQYAVEVSVQATTPGSAGNISQYAINTTSIPGVSNATNTYPFTGGADQETDASFRNRVLAIFSGSNIGTALGYKNLALSNTAVSDAVVIGPGNPLMIRDGTVVIQNPDGTFTIISEGTGGKVDILILGSILSTFTDTFIYLDKSNDNDPSNSLNNFVLGQIIGDANKTITQKRLDDITNGTLPAQPVQEILSVTGTLSGSNFISASTNSLGITTGNYSLIKDTGNYAGSPWGFDTFHWTSNQIVFNEDLIKSQFNGQDPTTFSGVLEIPNITQNISITNENSNVSLTNNTVIQLLHIPATNVTRVFNTNTGESYTVINQNFAGTGSTNTSGQIQISGNTLPSTSDILQVDYTWVVSYDPYSDYDGKYLNNNPRISGDSVDWGISNIVRDERVLFAVNSSNTFFIGSTSLPVTTVVSANIFSSTRGVVVTSTVPNFTNRLMVNIAAIDISMNTIELIRLSDTPHEVYNTAEGDGFLINKRIVVGTQIKYNTLVILPTDTTAVLGSIIEIIYNPTDVFNMVGSTGSFSGNQITVPVDNVSPEVFVADTFVLWQIFSNNAVIASGSDGYIIPISGDPLQADFYSPSNSFAGISISDTIVIMDSTSSVSNNGVFAIIKVPPATASNNITIQKSNQIYMDVTYIANVPNLLTVGITNFPISRAGNGYILNNSVGSVNVVESNTMRRENQTIQLNGSSQTYVTLSIDNVEFSLSPSQIVSVIDLTSQLEIWNIDFPGTVSTNANNDYVLTFSGFNSPTAGDNVLIIYFAQDVARVQPFTFYNQIFKIDFQSLLFNFTTNNFYVPVQNFIHEIGITFDIIDTTTGMTIGSATDGYISAVSSNAAIATFGSDTFNFANIDDLTGKTIRLINTVNVNNKGFYDIFSIISNNSITIGLPLANFDVNQVSVVRIRDGKDLWTTSGTIDALNNILNLPQNVLAIQNDVVAVILFGNKALHQSPTKISVTVADQVVNTGIVTIAGTTVTQVASIIFPAINNGLRQNALSAFKTFLGLSSNANISSNNYIVRVVSVKKVITTTNNQILNTAATYDIFGTTLSNNSLYPNEMLENETIQNTEFILPATINNINNTPKIGDSLLITFYYATDGNSENLYFTKNGTLYTNNKFALVDQIYISSGFNSSQSTRFTVAAFTQPATGSRYDAFYNYLAPKENERILIQYNYNQLITNVTFTIENARPIDADVLVKAAAEVLVDVTLSVIVSQTNINSAAIVLQNVKNAITGTINTNTLGATIYSSALIATAQGITGVNLVTINYFNKDGSAGQVSSLTCQENQYFVANTITVNQQIAS